MSRLPATVLGTLGGAARAELVARLDRFVALVLRWNRSIQVTAADSAEEIFERHVLDSLAILELGELPERGRLVDVGAGGGFPGAVLAIARPELEVTSLEPIHKKHAFLATAKRELRLANFHALAERDDVHRQRPDFAPYDIAVSRATFAVPEWLDRGLELIGPGGLVVAMEGRDQHPLPAGTSRHSYPLGDRQRALLVRRK
jgi:16S rRNA (guanine527-N7)-methyltransferase